MRVLVAVCMILVSGAVSSRGIAQPARGESPCPGETAPASLSELSYDVASIRLHPVDDGRMSFSGMPQEASITMMGIDGRNLVQSALGIQRYQLQGGPDWLSSRRFDVQAKGDESANAALSKLSTCWAVHVKNQALAAVLMDRMKLAVHHETKEMSGYVLVQTNGGAKLQGSKVEVDGEGNQKKSGMSMNMGSDHGAVKMTGQRMSSRWIATWLAAHLGAPVEDKTALTGTYDISLRFARDEMQASESGESGDAAPSLFTALQEQLGLKLEPAKVAADVVVIDHVEMPTEN